LAQRKLTPYGAASAVTIQSSVRSGAEDIIRVQVDYAQVPAPDAYYVADYAKIGVKGATVQITFGKIEGSDGTKLRNKLEVNIPAYAFMGQWMGALDFIMKVKKGLVEKHFPLYVLPPGMNEETDKVQTVHSNNSFITGGEGECCVDLYFLSPRDIRFYVERSETPKIEPLVRVIMESQLLVNLGESFTTIADQVRGFVPQQSPEDFRDA
jgi:hypothetical protein